VKAQVNPEIAKRIEAAGGKRISFRKIPWGLLSAIWLQGTVLVFIIVQVSRLNTPIAHWFDKAIKLFVGH